MHRKLYSGKTNHTLRGTALLVALQKSRTNETLIMISVSVVLQNVGLTTHWSRLLYQK